MVDRESSPEMERSMGENQPPPQLGMQEASTRNQPPLESQLNSFSEQSVGTTLEGKRIWMEKQLIVNEKGSHFGILRTDKEGKFFIDFKGVREITYSGKAMKLPAEEEVYRKMPEQKQTEKAEELGSSQRGAAWEGGEITITVKREPRGAGDRDRTKEGEGLRERKRAFSSLSDKRKKREEPREDEVAHMALVY